MHKIFSNEIVNIKLNFIINTMFHYRVIFLLLVLPSSLAKLGFIKDQSMEANFPPRVSKPDPDIPEGHLRPLGEYLTKLIYLFVIALQSVVLIQS